MSTASRYSLNKSKYLLDPEVQQLTHLLKSHIDRDKRNCTLLFLGLHTGGRAQELLQIRHSDLDSHHETVLIRGLKGSNDREIPVASWLFRELTRVSEEQLQAGSGEFVFPISYNRLYQIWDFYRPVAKKFHSLRHTFAIRLYKKTRDIRLLQVALGHRNIANTMIYADYVYSQSELRRLLL
ncbi:MAG: site-specific integrase [Pseudobdellovibrionaceae bacterium]|nr:site-specific integrase [Bdellovibrionales bacterium]USN48181.1 MAG: site-specific integrase [Pseudobdellovibrionaceae bacterium]